MIVGLLLELVLGLFSVLTAGISILQVPSEFLEVLESAMEWMFAGAMFLNNYADVPFMMSLLGVVLSFDVGMMIYRAFIWIGKKFPMVGIE